MTNVNQTPKTVQGKGFFTHELKKRESEGRKATKENCQKKTRNRKTFSGRLLLFLINFIGEKGREEMLNVLLNLGLFTVKFIGGKLSHSVSVISDAFNNLTDAVTTLLAWFGLKISAVGAGEIHPNGHGRFEWVIALLSSTSVIVIGWELLWDSINAVKNPKETVFGVFTLVVLLISIVVKFFMFIYNRKKSRETDSSSLKAVSVDCLCDSVSTAVVFVSLLVNTIFSLNIDGWCGILVSLFVMYNGFSSFSETFGRILGHSASREQLEEMKGFVLENSDFSEVLGLQIEDYGNKKYRVSMTVVGKQGVDAGNLLADVSDLRYRIFDHYGYDAQINLEQKSLESTELRSFVQDALDSMEEKPKIQSLRINPANGYDLVLLELAVEYMDGKSQETFDSRLAEKMSQAPEGYRIITRMRLTPGEGRHGRKRHMEKT